MEKQTASSDNKNVLLKVESICKEFPSVTASDGGDRKDRILPFQGIVLLGAVTIDVLSKRKKG